MRHEHARVIRNGAGLPAEGHTVHISVVERMQRLNGTLPPKGTFACTGCDVEVRAVLTSEARPGRKSSPSSYFSPSPQSHHQDCARSRSHCAAATRAASALPAAPVRTAIPAAWVAACQPATTSAASSHDHHAVLSLRSGRARRLDTGDRISQARTERVEAVARAWLQLSNEQRHQQSFKAPWAVDGSYATAVRDINRSDVTPAELTSQSIYMAVIRGIHVNDDRCTIRLAYAVRRLSQTGSLEHSNALQIVLPPTFGSTPTGSFLMEALRGSGSGLAGKTVFALGKFEWKFQRHGWYSMLVPLEKWLWIPSLSEVRLEADLPSAETLSRSGSPR